MSRRRRQPAKPAEAIILVDNAASDADTGERKLIGEELVAGKRLDSVTRDVVLQQQELKGGRFGDVGVALGVLTRDDVRWALSRQFRHPYANQEAPSPQSEELVMVRQAFSDEIERFRDLRSQLMMKAMNGSADAKRALAIVSADSGDGKTFLAANLAVSFSHLPGRTLALDCDMRSPRLHKLFGLEARSGLSDILSGRSVSNVVHPVEGLPNLYVLPVGAVPPNPLELIQGDAFPALLEEVSSKFDYVVVDTPAASHGSDAVVIASRVGQALIVGRQDHTRAKRVQQMAIQLSRASVQVVGIVMNEA